jgi:hypothetical protein
MVFSDRRQAESLGPSPRAGANPMGEAEAVENLKQKLTRQSRAAPSAAGVRAEGMTTSKKSKAAVNRA